MKCAKVYQVFYGILRKITFFVYKNIINRGVVQFILPKNKVYFGRGILLNRVS